MKTFRSGARPYTCLQCLLIASKSTATPIRSRLTGSTRHGLHVPLPRAALYHSSRILHVQQNKTEAAPEKRERPSIAPKPNIDIKSIRNDPDYYAQNCRNRNYPAAAAYPARITDLFAQWQAKNKEGHNLRRRANLIRHQITNPATSLDDADEIAAGLRDLTKNQLVAEARKVKADLSSIEAVEDQLVSEMESLALAIPNLTSPSTPLGNEPSVLSTINDHLEPAPASSDRVWRSHVHIGAELGLFDFAAAASSTGWGWYYLLDEAAQLEQALVSYALQCASRAGWRQVSPPSMVYSHMASACGFQPRDASGETQIYTIAQSASDSARGKPELCLAGTSEIPLAAMLANSTIDIDSPSALPRKRVAVSRCYRAEAGARGAETKGLYRVHEFTKVELFAWTHPDDESATNCFDEMVDLQTEMLGSLGLHCRVLEMPTGDLGASATRKIDIEAYFPSRREGRNEGWGEVTSASICTDYQTRRLATRAKMPDGKYLYPWTVNGTAMAVPRVLAALLENGWDEEEMSVRVPEVLWPWMDGVQKIVPKRRV